MFHENEYIDIVDKRYFKIDQHLARHFKYNGACIMFIHYGYLERKFLYISHKKKHFDTAKITKILVYVVHGDSRGCLIYLNLSDLLI